MRAHSHRLARGVLAAGLLLGALAGPILAQDNTPEPLPPPIWVSPTPDENGLIAVVVQPDESLWIIAARAGLSLPELLALNSLTENDVIRPGDVIIIGTGTPPPTAFSTEAGPPTATLPPPTLRPTRALEAATICLTAFEDTNQNGVQDPGETTTPGVAFSVFNRDQVVANVITDGSLEPHCVSGLTPGEYYVTRSILPGEVLTTDGDWAVAIGANNTLQQAFGSVRAVSTPEAAVASDTSNADTVAAVVPDSPPSQTPDSPLSNDRLLWGGVGLLATGGLILLSAVLLLLFRRARVK